MRTFSLSLLPLAGVLALAGCGNKDTPAQCLDDEFEPNHTLPDAKPLSLNAGSFAATDLYLCKGDLDWYSVEAAPGQVIEVTTTFAQGDGDLDLELYTEGFGLLGSSTSTADNETIRYVVSTQGVYYIKVLGKDPSSTNTYGLNVAVLGDECRADALEPNNSAVQPTELPDGTSADLTMCAFEEDWYRVDGVQGQVINVKADFDPAQYDLSMTLFTEAPMQEVASSDSSNDIEQIVHRVSNTGGYLLRVANKPEMPRAEYALDLEMSGEACTADSVEPNDSYLNATKVSGASAAYDDFELCYGDQDWFELDLSNGQAVTARLAFDSQASDLALYMYQINADGTLTYRTGSDNLTGDEVINFRPWESGTYVVSVSGSRGTLFGQYDLSFEVDGSACVADAFESNDAYANASAMAPASYDGLTLCVGDQDWYEFDVAAGQLIEVGLDYDVLTTDLGLSLYELNDDGTITGRNGQDLVGDTETFVYRPYQDGTFLAQVYRSRGTNVGSYSFDLNVSGRACDKDAFEPNDTALNAVPLQLNVAHEVTQCVGDADWYSITAAAGQLIRVNADFDEQVEDMGIQLYKLNSDGTISYRAGSDALYSDEFIQYQPYDGGTYLIYAYRSRGTEVADYTIEAQVTGDQCSDDTFEPNNLPQSPAALTPGVRNQLSLCVGDIDYYELTAGNGQVIDITADIDPTQTDVGMTLYSVMDDGTLIGRVGSDALDSDEHLTYRPFETGNFMLAVYRSRGATTASYNLNYQLLGSACADDSQEPNNLQAEATALPTGQTVNRTLCVGDADWYEVDLQAGQLLSVNVGVNEAIADVGVQIYKLNADGTISGRAGSDALNSDETVQYQPYDTGTFLVYVYRSRGAEVADYTLRADITGTVCSADTLEPNETSQTPRVITPGNRSNLSLCVGDTDWYKLSAGNGQVIDITADIDPTKTDVGMTLYSLNTDGTLVGRVGSDALDSDEHIVYRPFETGDFLLQVYRSRGAPPGSYNLNYALSGSACADDSDEPNNNAYETTLLTDGSYPDRTLCSGDVDYYEIDLVNGQTLNVDVLFNNADLGVQLYKLFDDGTLAGRAGSDDITDNESFAYTPFEDGTFILQVYRSRGTEVADYDLVIDVAGAECPDDIEEPNNALYEARALTLSGTATSKTVTLNDRALCTSDADYFTIPNVGLNQLISADIRFLHAESDLSFTLYKKNADGTYTGRVGSNTQTDQELVQYRAMDAGDYVLGVTRANFGTSMSPLYDMNVSVSGTACANDLYEPNQHWLTPGAPTLPRGTTVNGLTLCLGDDDWFPIGTVPSSKSIQVQATMNAADTDIGVQIWRLESDGSVTNLSGTDGVATSTESTQASTGSINNASYFVRTYRARLNGPAFYTLSVTIP